MVFYIEKYTGRINVSKDPILFFVSSLFAPVYNIEEGDYRKYIEINAKYI